MGSFGLAGESVCGVLSVCFCFQWARGHVGFVLLELCFACK